MKELSIKKLLEFRGKSEKGKRTFVENIKSNKVEVPAEGGGNYWITSLSAISNSYRQNDLSILDEKIEELEDKLAGAKHNISKNMYQRNIDILKNYKGLNLKKTRPAGRMEFLKKSSANSLLTIKGLKVQAQPSHIFTFSKNDDEIVGAIWFVSQLNGYKTEEAGMFADLLYRYLRAGYSKKYEISTEYCLAIDVVKGVWVNYSQIEKGNILGILSPTLDDINKLL